MTGIGRLEVDRRGAPKRGLSTDFPPIAIYESTGRMNGSRVALSGEKRLFWM